MVSRNQLSKCQNLAERVSQITALTRQEGGFVLFEEPLKCQAVSVAVDLLSGRQVAKSNTKEQLMKAFSESGLQVYIVKNCQLY